VIPKPTFLRVVRDPTGRSGRMLQSTRWRLYVNMDCLTGEYLGTAEPFHDGAWDQGQPTTIDRLARNRPPSGRALRALNVAGMLGRSANSKRYPTHSPANSAILAAIALRTSGVLISLNFSIAELPRSSSVGSYNPAKATRLSFSPGGIL